MNIKLTKKQMLILDFIRDFSAARGFSPSYREIMAGLDLKSVSAVAEHVDNLVAKGFLKKNPGEARSLEIIDTSYPETTELFKNRLLRADDKETEILLAAAEILGVTLNN